MVAKFIRLGSAAGIVFSHLSLPVYSQYVSMHIYLSLMSLFA